jgi:methylated-DNA-[protein]-cysteine S-methyltransferase
MPLSKFDRLVLQKVAEIPRGKVATYGEVARAIGKPGASRAVGNALAKNPYPVTIPCHRVVKGDLTLGGYTHGVEKKKLLLEEEGVEIVDGRVKREYLHRFQA